VDFVLAQVSQPEKQEEEEHTFLHNKQKENG